MRELTMWPGMDRTPFQIMEVEDFNTPIGSTGAKHNFAGDGTESIVVPGSFRLATDTTDNFQSFFHTWPVSVLNTDTCHMRIHGAFTFSGSAAVTERKFAFGFGTTAAIDANLLDDGAVSGTTAITPTDNENFFALVQSETEAEIYLVGQTGLSTAATQKSTIKLPVTGRIALTVDLKIKNGVVNMGAAWSAPGTNELRWFYPYGQPSPQPYLELTNMTMDGTYTLSSFFAIQLNGSTPSQIVDCDYLVFGKTRL